AGVDGKLRQVGEPVSNQGWIDSRRGAAHQRAKRIEICRSRSFGDQVRVEESVMSDLIIGVVVDVVAHFILNNLQGRSIVWIATAAWNFVVLAAAEFVVLDPKVGLDYFKRGGEPKQGRVARTQSASCFRGARADEKPRAD